MRPIEIQLTRRVPRFRDLRWVLKRRATKVRTAGEWSERGRPSSNFTRLSKTKSRVNPRRAGCLHNSRFARPTLLVQYVMCVPCSTMYTNILLRVHSLHEEISVFICERRIPIVAARIADLSQPESYSLLSRQNIPSGKPVDEIALAPSISRALILCGLCSS